MDSHPKLLAWRASCSLRVRQAGSCETRPGHVTVLTVLALYNHDPKPQAKVCTILAYALVYTPIELHVRGWLSSGVLVPGLSYLVLAFIQGRCHGLVDEIQSGVFPEVGTE